MKSPLVFRIYKNDQIHVVKQFIDDDRIVIGHGENADINLEAGEISAIHCLVEKRGIDYYLCDLGSTQGTFKNGKQVLDEVIQSGESFQVGLFSIFFFIGAQKSVKAGVVSELKPAFKAAEAATVSRVGKTFASKSEITDIRERIKGGAGPRLQVIVSWQERILETYHFPINGVKTLGPDGDLHVPEGSAPKGWKLLDLTNGVLISTTPEMKVEVLKDGELSLITDEAYHLNQSEACFISLINGMQIVIRFSSKAPPIIFDSPLILGASELTGILAALIIAVLTSLLVSVSKPNTEILPEEVERIAQVVFVPPTQLRPPMEVQETSDPNETKLIEEKKQTPPAELKNAVLMDETKESKVYGDPARPNQAVQKAEQKSGKAAAVKPKDPALKTKMFTSTKQGGSVKTGDTNGANAQSAEPDPTNSGLLAAFGEGGARSKLDKVYSGSGELIGTAEKAKGVSGFGATKAGDDLGSQFKDTGAGGIGTATQGISGVDTKGRGTGMSGYGSGTGFGDKDRVKIGAGGSEEAFVGSIDKAAVRRVVLSALPQFKACYEREFRLNTKLEGKVVISWEIHEQGVAKNAKVIKEKSTINNAAVEECVRSRMLGLRFPEPPPDSMAKVVYPFLFKAQGKNLRGGGQ